MKCESFEASIAQRDTPSADMQNQVPLRQLDVDISSSRISAQDGAESGSSTDERNVTMEQTLERVDGGASAWKVLCAGFVFEAILWGLFLLSLFSWSTTEYNRFSTFVWYLPELLLQASAVFRQPLYHVCRKYCYWNYVSRSAPDGAVRKAISTVPATHDLDRMGHLPCRSCHRFLCQRRG